MESALYEGSLRHRRFTAPSRDFTYELFMVYLDLGELDRVFSGRLLWSTGAPNLAWFRRADHYGDPTVPLASAIRDLVLERTGARPAGPIRLLTHLRYLGYGFNPVSFYYCFAEDGRTVATVVAEVNNTPWGERHMYVLPEASSVGRGEAKVHAFPKAFHVSPFLPMDLGYLWRFGPPAEELWVHMKSHEGDVRVFEATLRLSRRPITGRELARALVRRPAMTAQVVFAIYSEALRLWLSRARFYPHPTTDTPEAR